MSVYHWADKGMLRRLMDSHLLNSELRRNTTALTTDNSKSMQKSEPAYTGRALPVLKAMFGHAGKIQSCLLAFRINED